MRVALVDGKLVANPTYAQLGGSPLEIVIAGTEDAILMVESGGKEIAEDKMLEALAFGLEQCKALARHAEGADAARRPSPAWRSTARRRRSRAGRRA